MLNYMRYFIVIILLGLLFYSHTISIESSTLKAHIEKKLPLHIEKKGFLLTINNIKILETKDNILSSKVLADVQVSHNNRWAKFLPKKPMHLSIFTKTIPKLHNSSLSFEVLSLRLNKVLKLKEVKGLLKTKLEEIKIPIRSLKKIAWFASIKKISFQDNGNLLIKVGISKLIILFLIPLFLLREIGLVLITFYQKFLSPRKKYRCAKGELYQDGTCSSSTKEAFKKHGFVGGMKEYRRSTKECKKAYKTLTKDKIHKDSLLCDSVFCSTCGDIGFCAGDNASSGASVCDCGAAPCDVGSC